MSYSFHNDSFHSMESTSRFDIDHAYGINIGNRDALLSLDLQGRLVSLNLATEEITGYSKEELIDFPFLQLLSKGESRRFLIYFKLIKDGRIVHFDTAIQHKMGHTVRLRINAFPIRKDGEIKEICLVAEDVTQLRKLVERLYYYQNNFHKLENNILIAANEMSHPLNRLKELLRHFQEDKASSEDYAIMQEEIVRVEKLIGRIRESLEQPR